MLQLRDESLSLLPGVEIGDIGSKVGDAGHDVGFMRLKDVRIPRRYLFERRVRVEKDGTYTKVGATPAGGGGKEKEKPKGPDKRQYLTMMNARVTITGGAAGKLAIAATIATRYSCVRTQGFTEGQSARGQYSFQAPEMQIIDYQMQGYRVLKQVAITYALKVNGQWLNKRMTQASRNKDDDGADLPEVHATVAGLKGLSTKLTADGIEDMRRACGGHGYLLSSGVAPLEMDFKVWRRDVLNCCVLRCFDALALVDMLVVCRAATSLRRVISS
jgi:acyl-CoA oxidase